MRWYHVRRAVHTIFLRHLAHSNAAWAALDRAGIAGFGTHLLRFDFPPRTGQRPSWGHGRPAHPQLADYLAAHATVCRDHARAALAFANELADIPDLPTAAQPLAWQNQFQSPLDLVFGYGLIRSRRITHYLEIGSGVSTHLAARARTRGTPFEIACIDPEPRVGIGSVADRVSPQRMEDVLGEIVARSGAGTVLFFDGSHFAFPGSDVTRFFLDVLPALRAGTLVHVHDVYLPDDYPPAHLNRLWNEQYLLASWLLGGAARVRPILPGHWLAGQIAADGLDRWLREVPDGFRAAHALDSDSSCWWMEIV